MRSLKILCIALMLLANAAEAAVWGEWTHSAIDRILHQAGNIADTGNRIDFISAQFLNTPYRPHTLIGSETRPEQLIVRLDAVDCLTYLEYVEALRRSTSPAAFLANLKKVRYRDGKVEYSKRKHFFSSWIERNEGYMADVTAKVGRGASLEVIKRLNEPDPTPIVPGIPMVEKAIRYLPSDKIDASVLSRLKNGDYIGIYTDRNGLDVDHVGIVIKNASNIYFRHADAFAPNKKVVDTDFLSFFKDQKGFMVFRPK